MCRYALLTVQRLTEVLQRGPLEQRPPTLLLLRCLLEAPGLHLGPKALYPAALFAPVATLLRGPCASDALKVRTLTPNTGNASQRCQAPAHNRHASTESTMSSKTQRAMNCLQMTICPGFLSHTRQGLHAPVSSAAQVLEALMRCSDAHADEPAATPANRMLPPAVSEPDQALRRAGLGALERVVASCPGVPRSLPLAARAEASEF